MPDIDLIRCMSSCGLFAEQLASNQLQQFSRASRFCTRNDGSVNDKGDLDLGANTSKGRKQIFDPLGHRGSRDVEKVRLMNQVLSFMYSYGQKQ